MKTPISSNGNLRVFEIIKISLLISILLAVVTLFKNDIVISHQSTIITTLTSTLITLQALIVFVSLLTEVLSYLSGFVLNKLYNQRLVITDVKRSFSINQKQVEFKLPIRLLTSIVRC